MSRARLGVVLLAAAALGCEDAREPFDLQALEAGDDCLTVVHASLELGGPLHRFVGDSLGSPGGWGLITLDDMLAIVRVPASADEPPTSPIYLGVPEEFADDTSLRIGRSGELWVLLEAGIVSLRRMLPGIGEAARNDSLANFPTVDHVGSCPSAYTRSVLLIEGRPYIVAVPDCADGPALLMHLLALEPETLEFVTAWQLAFDPCDGYEDTASCALVHAYSLESIGAPGSAPQSTLDRVAVAFTQVRAFSGLLRGSLRLADVSLLDMRMTAEGPNARLVSYREVWDDSLPFSLGPVEVTRDPFSTQVHVRNQLHDDDAVLIRLDTVADEYSLLTSVEQLPLAGRGRLVQLGDAGAMIDVQDGALQVVGLRDWPNWTTHTMVELPDLVDFEVSGVGQLLLRREDSPPRVVHLTCVGD